MHGRLKVRTTEEEAVRRKKEQALKVKAYRVAMAKILAKRADLQLDRDMLTMTAQVLLRNPDLFTLWNIRRECLLAMTETPLERTVDELMVTLKPTKTSTDEKRIGAQQALYETDLSLTEQCLLSNPKSYAAWHHRCWILEHCPRPDWEREMCLCRKYLKMDERNFHTWDYRRYVVAKAGVSARFEVDFCTEKIRVNFSNYSSWHYRSLLLPRLFPPEGDSPSVKPMSEEKLKEELDLVLTATFTDPGDSSAWFYQRWLLGYPRPALDICAFRTSADAAVLAFTKPIGRQLFEVSLAGSQHRNWKAASGSPTDNIWYTIVTDSPLVNVNDDTSITPPPLATDLVVTLNGNEPLRLPLRRCSDGFFYFRTPNPENGFSPTIVRALQTQLEACQSLLEFEPESKWTLLTSALLMRAIDHNRYYDECLQHLCQLQHVDELRSGYYSDLRARWKMQRILEKWHQSEDFPARLDLTEATDLTFLYYKQYLCIADMVVLPENLEHYAHERLGLPLPILPYAM